MDSRNSAPAPGNPVRTELEAKHMTIKPLKFLLLGLAGLAALAAIGETLGVGGIKAERQKAYPRLYCQLLRNTFWKIAYMTRDFSQNEVLIELNLEPLPRFSSIRYLISPSTPPSRTFSANTSR